MVIQSRILTCLVMVAATWLSVLSAVADITAPIRLHDLDDEQCHEDSWQQLPLSSFPDVNNDAPYSILLANMDFFLPDDDNVTDICQELCLNTTIDGEECRFYTDIWFTETMLGGCYLLGHTNNWTVGNSWGYAWYAKPRFCLPNDGCRYNGEYIANSRSRCEFDHCAPGVSQSLRARRFHCAAFTTLREDFLSSRYEGQYFTQPCSQSAVNNAPNCIRHFPLFAP